MTSLALDLDLGDTYKFPESNEGAQTHADDGGNTAPCDEQVDARRVTHAVTSYSSLCCLQI